MVGKGREFVEREARRRALQLLKGLAQTSKQRSSGWDWCCLTPDAKNVTLNDGSKHKAVVRGKPQTCGPCFRLADGSYLMTGPEINIIQSDGAKNTGLIISANYPAGTLQLSNPSVTWTTAWPLLTVFDIQDQTNYWEETPDLPLNVFSDYTNPDFLSSNIRHPTKGAPGDPTGHDGFFYAALKPDASEFAILRVNPVGRIFTNASETPQPTNIDLVWTVMKQLHFNDPAHSLDGVVTNGARTLSWPGRIADVADLDAAFPAHVHTAVQNQQDFRIVPFFYWKTDGSFEFDITGEWLSTAVGVPPFSSDSTTITGFAYAEGVVSGGSVVSIPGKIFSGNDLSFYVQAYTGLGERSRQLFNNNASGTANTITDGGFSAHTHWCAPYGTEIQDITSSPLDTLTFDTQRVYDLTTIPVFGSTPPDTSVDIKTISDSNFVVLQVLSTGSDDVITLTDYSWNSTLSLLASGLEVDGNAIAAGTDNGQIGTIMDWLIA